MENAVPSLKKRKKIIDVKTVAVPPLVKKRYQ
jgi:hypothetical protein